MASPEPQPRFGQSVKGLLSEKVSACSGDVIALTRQVLKGSRSQEEGEAMVVDGDAAAILRSSRFADDFMIRPVEEGAAADVGCCPAKPKEIIVNPFELAKHLEPADIKPATGGCCGPKPLDAPKSRTIMDQEFKPENSVQITVIVNMALC
ncbi:UPF0693 protein C10orf32-like [Acipenser ruthenus]|uniref:BLOC-1-related complex subunit 7 n=1 Tax=Acipenser ruthenus TaxID=7906 RepID=A0A444TWX9_ACIRT|nr:UPF0693 protein C10orf32-like [Acipenser ruthenus]